MGLTGASDAPVKHNMAKPPTKRKPIPIPEDEDEGETPQQTFRRQSDAAYAALQRARQRTFRAFGRRDYTPDEAERAHVAKLMEREVSLLLGAVRTGVRVRPGAASIWQSGADANAAAKPKAKLKPPREEPEESEEESEEESFEEVEG